MAELRPSQGCFRPGPLVASARRSGGVFLLAVLVCLGGCEPTVLIRGSVLDVRGQALPGVAVTVRDTGEQATTSGVGSYSLRCLPGIHDLDFMKTGYTPGRLYIEADALRSVEATEVRLWPLPPGTGVYLYEDYRYFEATRAKPDAYIAMDGSPVHGTKKTAELATASAEPLLICHKLPPFDTHLYRLHPTEAAVPPQPSDPSSAAAAPSFTETVWAPADAFTVIPVPIDEPEQLLIELRLTAPLPPGTYAVHWGALDGHTTTDPRIFLFRVAEPRPSEGEEENEAPAPAAGP